MPLGKKFRLAVFCMVFAIAGTMWWSNSRPKDPVQAHLEAIRFLEMSWARPSTFRDYFRYQTWLWYFRSRPNFQTSFAEREAHQKALLELGYFETRTFSLHHRVLDNAGFAQLNSLSTNFTFSDGHWTMTMTGDQPSTVSIMARPEDMPIWSNIVQRFDQSDAR